MNYLPKQSGRLLLTLALSVSVLASPWTAMGQGGNAHWVCLDGRTSCGQATVTPTRQAHDCCQRDGAPSKDPIQPIESPSDQPPCDQPSECHCCVVMTTGSAWATIPAASFDFAEPAVEPARASGESAYDIRWIDPLLRPPNG